MMWWLLLLLLTAQPLHLILQLLYVRLHPSQFGIVYCFWRRRFFNSFWKDWIANAVSFIWLYLPCTICCKDAISSSAFRFSTSKLDSRVRPATTSWLFTSSSSVRNWRICWVKSAFSSCFRDNSPDKSKMTITPSHFSRFFGCCYPLFAKIILSFWHADYQTPPSFFSFQFPAVELSLVNLQIAQV